MENKNKNTTTRSGGIGFAGALTLIFITLKLCKVIDWSWWWVLSPIWITFGIVLTILFVAFAALLITKILTK
jgi:membrane protein YdbS with pleckstrin-like domain